MQFLLTTLNAKYIHTNLAIRLLYALNKHHTNLHWKEFTIKEDKQKVAEFCAEYTVVAFSCYIWNISQTLAVCRLIKNINPSVKILLGGPEVSYDYDQVIARGEVDFIIPGEGEIPFAEFLKCFPDVQQVPALVYKTSSGVLSNPLPPMFDLKNYEGIMPYAHDKPEELRNRVLYLETSRGCPYKCEFCLASLDNKVRYLPYSSIKSTLLHLMQNGKVIKFLDRTFNMKRDFTLDIFRFILDHHRPGNVFQFEITADILHPDIIRFIQEEVPPGLFRFEIGIQTVNQKANLAVSRKQNFEKTKHIIRQVEQKVEMHLDLIVGLPYDCMPDIKYSFEEVFKLFAPELQLGFLKFLKGTTLRHMEEHGYVFDPEPPYQIIESNYLSRHELYEITLLEHALEIYWNSGKARNTLRYVAGSYSVFDFLCGLGKHFETRKSFHDYTFDDVFEIAREFVSTAYKQDALLVQFLALDYYLHFKVKPKPLLLSEIPKPQKQQLIAQLQLNQHKYRFVMLPLDFDPIAFKNTGGFDTGKHIVCVQYTGTEKAKIAAVVEASE